LVSDGTERQMHLDTLSWPTQQSPHKTTHVVSQSLTVQACQVILNTPLSLPIKQCLHYTIIGNLIMEFLLFVFVDTAINYRCQSLQARRADINVLLVTAAELPEYIIT